VEKGGTVNYTSPYLGTIGKVNELIQGGPLPKLDNDAVSGRNIDVLFEEEN
jgi:hypothetical protein